MVEDFSQNKSESNTPATRKPAIRTMKTDVEELFKSTKPSLLQIIGGEIQQTPSYPRKDRKINYLYLGLGALVLVLAISGIVFFATRPVVEVETPKLITPSPYFATESSRTIAISTQDRNTFLRLMTDSYRELEREGTIKRILIKLKDGPSERFAAFQDFSSSYRMNPPARFSDFISPPLMTFFYYGRSSGHFGFAVKTLEPDRTLRMMLSWEPSLINDLRPLLFDRKPETTIAPFEDRTYRNIDWRFQKLSQTDDVGVGYTVFPAKNLLIVTTSKESMETIINRLFDSR